MVARKITQMIARKITQMIARKTTQMIARKNTQMIARKTTQMIAKTAKQAIKNILLIEDEGEMCLLLTLLLNDQNVRIAHVKSLAEADAFLQKRQPSLILLDNRLPDGFGVHFIALLRAHYPSIKIILMSGVDVAAGDFAVEAGADLFLAKPFTKAKLLQSVNQLLN
jgi:two-component system OmpR family response regulator